MHARLFGRQLIQIAVAQVEVVLRPDDSDAQVADRELTSLVEIGGIVEPDGVPAIDEGHTTGADDLAAVSTDDERRILVDADPEQLPVRGNDEEEPLQTAALGEVGIDDGVVAEQAKTGTEILLDEVALLIH